MYLMKTNNEIWIYGTETDEKEYFLHMYLISAIVQQ